MSSFITSNCTCCFDCPKHQVNARHGYIIPCNDKANCEKYTFLQDNHRIAKEAEHLDRVAKSQAYESEKYRLRKRHKKL